MRSSRLALSVSALVLAAASLSGCAIADEFVSHEKEQVFASYGDAPQEGDTEFAPPAFVPEDSTDLKIRVITNGVGGLLRYTSTQPVVGDSCEPGALQGDPTMQTTWWPTELPGEGWTCDDGWQLFQQNGHTYGWSA